MEHQLSNASIEPFALRSPVDLRNGEPSDVSDLSPPLAAVVASRLRNDIVRGTLPSGTRLYDFRIAEEWDISRAPVREALNQLEAEGLVESTPRKGRFVRSLARQDTLDLCEFRSMLERAAVVAARRRGETSFDRLLDGVEGIRAGADASDRATVVQHETQFHAQLVAAGGNAHLSGTYRQLLPRIQMLMLLDSVAQQEQLHEVADRHLALAVQLRDGADPQVVEDHIMAGAAKLVASLPE